MKMDASKFKKVSSDEQKTVLMHPRGHKIIIAHEALHPSTRKQLNELPGYADGGGVSGWDKFKNDLGDAVNEVEGPPSHQTQSGQDFSSMYNVPSNAATPSPVENRVPASDPAPTAEQAVSNEADASPTDAAPVAPETAPQQEPTPQSTTQEMPPSDSIQGDAPVADSGAAAQDKGAQQDYQKGFHDYYQQNAQKLGQEDAAWQHDLANGHVTPETYHDLFAKKDTLGKIGMLFGLLVSSAGSGLAHQQNALLGAMNQEIMNDYNAQLQSKGNAQNFLKIHQQQALNDAQIKYQGQQGKLTEAQAKAENAQADINAQSATLMKMNRTAFHNLALQVDKMPPGPQRQQAEQALAMTGSAIDAKNYNIADIASSRGAMAKMLGGSGSGTPNTTLLKTIPGMEGVAKDIEDKTVPGVGRAQIPVPQETRDRVTALQQYGQKAREYVDFAKQHASNWANMNPMQRQQVANQGAAMGANLQSLYRNKIKGGVYKKGEQEFIQQIIPDNPVSWKSSFNAIPKVEQTINDNSNDLQTTAKSVGLNVGQPDASQQVQKSKSGREMIQKNGKWYYK